MGTIGPADRDSRNKFFAKRLLTEQKYTHVQNPKACMLFGYSTWVRQQFDQVILEIFYQHISQNHPCVGHSRQECWSFFCPLTRICFLDWCIFHFAFCICFLDWCIFLPSFPHLSSQAYLLQIAAFQAELISAFHFQNPSHPHFRALRYQERNVFMRFWWVLWYL